MTETIEARLRRGVAAHQVGRLVEATEMYRGVLVDAPDNSLAHYHLGRAAMQRNSLVEAEREFSAATRANPQEPMLHVLLADVLLRLRRPEDARKSAQRALAINPLLPAGLARLGAALLGLNKLRDAEKALQHALEISPRNADASKAMVTLRLRQRQFAEAERLAADVIRAQPKEVEGYILFGDCFFEQGKFVQAIMAYRRARNLDSGNVSADEKYRTAIARLGGFETARAALEAAVAHSSERSMANMVLGEFLNSYGYTSDALACFQQVLATDPANSSARSSIAFAHKFRSRDDQEFTALEDSYRASNPQREGHDLLSFAMGKALDDLKDYEASIDHAIEGNDLRRAKAPYDIGREAVDFEGIKRAFTADYIKSRRHSGDVSPTPIFVVGMPRSGTTLTEQVLSGNPLVYAAGELDFLEVVARSIMNADPIMEATALSKTATKDAFRRVAATYLQWLPTEARSKQFVVDKMPHNFRMIGMIRLVFPDARIVHVKRNPLDNCVSMFKIAFSASGLGFTNDLTDLGHYYNLYRGLMRHWNEVLPGEIFDLQYEVLVADPEATSRALFHFCGLEWSPGVLDFHERRGEVRTASVNQVRRPIYKDSVDRSARYGAKLDPLRAALAEWDDAQ